ncbi:hypothetical protein SOHN41_01222 [Shewanella sp. HN-41]|nr:hypothetical protein SOHN41_01222 [Shewanella sp. HN-41]
MPPESVDTTSFSNEIVYSPNSAQITAALLGHFYTCIDKNINRAVLEIEQQK